MNDMVGIGSPKVSVIMPCYNAAQYLETALKSVLDQTLKDLELIAVDNGSTDRTYEILKRYEKADRRLKIVRLMKNQGPSGGRNAGMRIASGEYIAFMDSDDELPSDAYEAMYDRAKSDAYDLVAGSILDIITTTETYYHDVGDKKCGDAWAVLDGGAVWNKLYNRRFLKVNRLTFENYTFGEDMLFLGRVLCCKPSIIRISKIVYHYKKRMNESSDQLTKTSSLQAVREYAATRKILHGLPLGLQKEEFFLLNYWLVRFLVEYCDRLEFFQERAESFEYIRDFAGMVSWDGKEDSFRELFSVSYATFMRIGYGDYLLYRIQNKKEDTFQPQPNPAPIPDPRERVLNEFRNGGIGFRYILRYIKCWLSFKLHGSRK